MRNLVELRLKKGEKQDVYDGEPIEIYLTSKITRCCVCFSPEKMSTPQETQADNSIVKILSTQSNSSYPPIEEKSIKNIRWPILFLLFQKCFNKFYFMKTFSIQTILSIS